MTVGFMRCRLTRTLGSAIVIAVSATAAGAGYEPVHITSETSGRSGNGVRFAIRGGCATVTASHIVNDAGTPLITPVRSGQAPTTVEVDNLKADIAVIHQKHMDPEDCLPAPDVSEMAQALRGTTREVWHITSSGDVRIFKVDLLQISEETLTLKLVDPNPDDEVDETFSPGMSGSVVVFNSVPVAYLKSIPTQKGGFAVAERLDYVLSRYSKAFPERAVVQQRTIESFDISGFPRDIKEVVEEARSRKRRIVRIMREAEAVKRKAEDAAAQANLLPKDNPRGGLANFLGSSGNLYAGEIYHVGNTYGSSGYGISEVGDGDSVGTKFYCRFVRDKGCVGVGVVEFADNPGNGGELERWVGTLDAGQMRGDGYLKWHNGGEAWYFRETEKPRPAIWVDGNDGRVFEGEVDTTWNGRGALWRKDGTLILIGVWKGGKVEKDRTDEIR
jgi:hypothetical protein